MEAANFNSASSGRVIQEPITAKLVTELKAPFRVFKFENFFSPEMYSLLCEEMNNKLKGGLHTDRKQGGFVRSDAKVIHNNVANQYGAYIYRLHERETGPFAIFFSRLFHDYFQNLVDFRLDPHVMGSIHHHQPNSPTGWIHNDFHFCNFNWNPNSDGINPWTEGCTYQYGYDPRPEVLKTYRSMALLYYFNNEPWKEGDGGETWLFKTMDWKSVFMKCPPVNNTLLAFEITPHSYHSFVTNVANVRNSVAFWFHSDELVSLQKFKVFPKVSQVTK